MTAAERRAVKMKFSYMFQGTALFDSMTVYDNVALPLKEKGRVPFREIEAACVPSWPSWTWLASRTNTRPSCPGA
jgi:ABC-type transporter Mla maintaining outer membrane lipid asymmetry ATPase subunit MlaF